MSAKHLKKNTRQKKLINTFAVTGSQSDNKSDRVNSVEGKEAAIIRQFNQIQKDYMKLMNDLVKEFGLVKGWIGSQALSKRKALKNSLTSRLSRI